MKKILLIFPVLSYLILAAHELRTGDYLIMAGWLLLAVFILVLKKPWVRHLSIFGLMLGLLVWSKVTIFLLQVRLVMEESYALLLGIMGVVAGLAARDTSWTKGDHYGLSYDCGCVNPDHPGHELVCRRLT